MDLLREKEWPVPDAGFELTDSTGEVIAEAELGWPETHIAFLDLAQMDYAAAFEGSGWRTSPLAEVLNDPEMVLSSYAKKEE